MKTQRDARQRDEEQPGQRGGELERLAAALVLEQLGEDGHEGGRLSAASATSARTRFGTWKASVNADAAPGVPK